MLAVVLSVVATVVLALSVSNAFPWLQGRLNSSFPGLLANLIGLAAWAVLTVILLWVLATRPRERGAGNRASRVALGAIVFLPWLILPVAQDATAAFTQGFSGWAAANVNAHAIRDWRANLAVTPATAPAPLWWPTVEYEVPLGTPISRGFLSSDVAQLRPDEVRLLPGAGPVLLSWEGGPAGWVRFVLVDGSAHAPPPEFRQHHMLWRRVNADVLVGVAQHH